MLKSKKILFIAAFFVVSNLKAATYTTIAAGSYQNPAIWDCTCVPPVNQWVGHVININHALTSTSALSINGNTTFNINATGSLDMSGNNFDASAWSPHALTIANGASLTANRVQFGGNNTPAHTINGQINTTVNLNMLNQRNVNFGATADLNIGLDVRMEPQNPGVITLGGDWAVGRDLRVDQNGTINGNLTANVVDDITFGTGGFNFDPTTVNLTIGDDFDLNGSTVDIGTGTIDVVGDFNMGGGASIEIDADIDICGNFAQTGGPAATFNGEITVKGNMSKSGGGAITLNDNLTVTGSFTGTGGSGTNDIYVANGATWTVASVTTSGGWDITVDGQLNVTGAINMTGGARIEGNGIVGWGTYTSDCSPSPITCTGTGAQHDNNACSAPTAPPGNPLDLSTCTPGVLPVDFIYVKGEYDDGKTHLSWGTATETNNSHFTVERSADGRSFEVLGTIPGAGNSQEIQSYEYEDDNPEYNSYYYKIKQTDFDGSYAYSTVIYLQTGEDLIATVTPNPATDDHVNVVFSEIPDEDVSFSLISSTGEEVTSGIYTNLFSRYQTLTFGNDVKPGVYFVVLRDRTRLQRIKFLIK